MHIRGVAQPSVTKRFLECLGGLEASFWDSRVLEARPWDTNMTAVRHAPPWCSSAVRYQTFLLERLGVLEAMFLDSGILEARPWDTNMTAVHHAPPWCSSAVRCQTFLLEYLGILEALFFGF